MCTWLLCFQYSILNTYFDVMLQVCVPFIIILSQGEGNHGFDVLIQNFKTQTTASKELAEYIKER